MALPPRLQAMLSQQDSFYTNNPPQLIPTFNIPGLSGSTGLAVQMMLEPMLRQFMGNNWVPGQLFPEQSLFTQLRARQDVEAHRASMTAGMMQDQDTWIRATRGISSAMGLGWSETMERNARLMARDFQPLAMIAAQVAPDAYGAAHGFAGSRAVMAGQVWMGARVSMDPVTGRPRMSADSTNETTRQLFDHFYGATSDPRAAAGLRSDQIGSLFNELATRGFGPPSMSRQQGIEGLARERGGNFQEAMAAINGLANPQLESRLREFNGRQTAQYISKLTEAIAGVGEIFGDMGHPNAPMSQLFDALQAMTQGGVATMSRERLATVARETFQISRITKVSFEQQMRNNMTIRRATDALGLDPTAASPIAREMELFSRAYGSMTGGFTGPGAWASPEHAGAARGNALAGAQASEVANQMAATFQLNQMAPGGAFRAGTEAAAMMAALNNRSTHYEFGGQRRLVYDATNPNRWLDIMRAADIDPNLANRVRSQTSSNAIITNSQGYGSQAGRLQGEVDARPQIEILMQDALLQANFTPETARRGAIAAAQGLLHDMGPAQGIANMEQMGPGLAEYLSTRLNMNLTPAQREALTRASTMGVRNLNEWTTNMDSSRQTIAQRLTGGWNTQILDRQAVLADEATVQAELARAAGSLRPGGLHRRIWDELQNIDESTPVADVVARLLGGVPSQTVRDRMAPFVSQMVEQRRRLMSQGGRGAGAVANRDDAVRQIRDLLDEQRREASAGGINLDENQITSSGTTSLQDALSLLGSGAGGFQSSVGLLFGSEGVRQQQDRQTAAAAAMAAGALFGGGAGAGNLLRQAGQTGQPGQARPLQQTSTAPGPQRSETITLAGTLTVVGQGEHQVRGTGTRNG